MLTRDPSGFQTQSRARFNAGRAVMPSMLNFKIKILVLSFLRSYFQRILGNRPCFLVLWEMDFGSHAQITRWKSAQIPEKSRNPEWIKFDSVSVLAGRLDFDWISGGRLDFEIRFINY